LGSAARYSAPLHPPEESFCLNEIGIVNVIPAEIKFSQGRAVPERLSGLGKRLRRLAKPTLGES